MFGSILAIFNRFQNVQKSYIERSNSFIYPWDRAAVAGTDDITYSVDTTLTSRIIVGDVITINSGITVTTMAGGVIFICNSFVNNGTLTASGKGAAGGAHKTTQGNGNPGTAATQISSRYLMGGDGGGGGGSANTYTGGVGGAAHSGAGGTAGAAAGAGGNGTNDVFNIIDLSVLWNFIIDGNAAGAGAGGGGSYSGSIGGYGGAGGGTILIVCGDLNNAGAIYAEGVDGESTAAAGGGGGGGLIVIDTQTVTAEGTISADGGTGGTGSSGRNGGNGGNGKVIIMERWAA